MKTKTIAIVNHKGGVGKTTSVACIGAALSILGKKTLVIDLDAQQNLTYSILGHIDNESSIYDAMINKSNLPIISISENLSIVPASLELARAEIDLSTRIAREGILKSLLSELHDTYDYILLDCPPSLGTITTNALVAADEVYIPLTAEALPLKGLKMLEDVVNEIIRLVKPSLRIGGIFFTRFNHRNLNKIVKNQISERYNNVVFETIVRENISLAEMPLSAKSIYEYAPDSNGAKDYMELTKEIINRNN